MSKLNITQKVSIFNHATKELWRGIVVGATTIGIHVKALIEKDIYSDHSEWVPLFSKLIDVTYES